MDRNITTLTLATAMIVALIGAIEMKLGHSLSAGICAATSVAMVVLAFRDPA